MGRKNNKEATETETINIDPALKNHSLFEDIFALAVGSLMVSFGVCIFTNVEFLTGGTAGIAFLTSYATDFSFGQVFFVINLPFFILAIIRLGWEFTLKTFIAVVVVSVFSEFIPQLFEFGKINKLFGAIFGGFLIGSGLLMLFRHKASLGGLNIISLYLQKYHNVNAGRFLMVADVIIIICSFFIVNVWSILYSVLAAIFTNLVLTINFKKGRYLGSLDD